MNWIVTNYSSIFSIIYSFYQFQADQGQITEKTANTHYQEQEPIQSNPERGVSCPLLYGYFN